MAKEAASPSNNNRAKFARGGTLFKSSGFWIGLLLAVTLAVLGLSSCGKGSGGGGGSAQDDTSSWERKSSRHRVIIFVHGVMGDPKDTWTNDGTKATFPKLVAKDKTFDDADIYVFGYPSKFRGSTLDVDQLSDLLHQRLTAEGIVKNYDELVFVAHSMGGLVVRDLLLKDGSELAKKVPMVYSFATPYTGSDAARIADTFGNNPQFTSMRKLASGSYLGSLQTRWSAFPERKQIRTFCAYETAPVVSVNITDAIIVARESATNGCSERIDPIADNHIGIVKPANDHSQSFIVLENAYNSMFQATATQLELTAQSLPSLVDLLRVDTRRRNYIVKGPIDIRKVTAAREAWFVDNLEFAPGAVIYVGSVGLELKIRGRVTVPNDDQVVIASFPPEEAQAARGSDGGPGAAGPGASGTDGGGNGNPGGNGQPGGDGKPGVNGANAGDLVLQLAAMPNKRIMLSLVGQKGGDGGYGGPGGNGGAGAGGAAGQSGAFGCNRGGGNAGQGGNGGPGGSAGPGGNGGAGGHEEVSVPPSLREVAQQFVKASLQVAAPGSAGAPGGGGGGAASGRAGDGNGFCGGGAGKGPGSSGGPGGGPNVTPIPGAAPTLVIKSSS